MKTLQISIILMIGISLVSSIHVVFAYGVSTSLGGPIRSPNVLLTQILASGDNVYLLGENEGRFFFQKSTNGGATFESPIQIINSSGSRSVEPQMAVSNNN